MMTLYYAPGACSMAAHIVLEESGEKYQPQQVDLAGGEQRTEAYLKINPQGRVPVLRLDNGEPLAENTAILPYLGRRFGLWPTEAVADAKALSLIGFFAASVHPAHAHVGRPERYAADPSAFPTLKETGLKAFHGYLKQIDDKLAGREWFGDKYSVLDCRIPNKQILIDEIAAWEHDRNANHTKADWQFTTKNARIKLKHLYPAI